MLDEGVLPMSLSNPDAGRPSETVAFYFDPI